MKESNLLRLSIIVQAGQTRTFNSSLSKLIYMTIYDNDNRPLTLQEIKQHIKSNYDLEFTADEVSKSIEKEKNDYVMVKETEFVEVNEKSIRDVLNKQAYKLQESIIKKFRNNEKNNNLDRIIGRYIGELDISIDSSRLENLMNCYLYGVFNSNKDTLLELLDYAKEKSKHTIEICDFDEAEKKIINDFLSWDDKAKDQFIFNTLSYCVDYCMLTVRKDNSSYKDLFNGKVFYLDSNVILRLAGINNEERRDAADSFIKKVKENGIAIRYTNFTEDEVRKTLRTQIKFFKQMTYGREVVDAEYFEKFTGFNADIIKLFGRWCKENGNNYEDFDGFEKSILYNINDILSNFEKDTIIGYDILKPKIYSTLYSKLIEHKRNNKSKWTKNSIKVDVVNYMHIHELRRKAKGSNFKGIKHYLISTDKNLCEWGKTILPGTLPIAVEPSVWHSLLLKFKGRTNDDFKAFKLFLNLRYRTEDGGDKKKLLILSNVQKMDDEVELKNMILSEISENLTSKYNDIDDVNEIIETARESVIDEAIRSTEDRAEANLALKLDEERKRITRKLAEDKANGIIRWRGSLASAINVVKIIIGVVAILAFYIFMTQLGGVKSLAELLQKDIYGYDIPNWVSIVSTLIGIGVFFVLEPVKKLIEAGLDRERLIDKIEEDLIKAIDDK